MTIAMFPMYGILVTQKSWLLGLRSLALQHYAASLAHKVVESRLPPELCDEIGAELSKLHFRDAKQVWKRMKDDPDARTMKFRDAFDITIFTNHTESEDATTKKFGSLLSCDVAEGQITLRTVDAKIDLLDAEGKDQRYTHVSASLNTPSVSMLVPGAEPYSGGPAMSLANKAMTVVNAPARPDALSLDFVSIRLKRPDSAKRLVQLDDVEACIRGWNQQFVENFVEQLMLDVVTPGGEKEPGGGMKPQLRLLQHLNWN